MQSRSLKPRKNYPKFNEFAIAPLDPNSSYARILELVGERKKVLDVGCGNGNLASLFLKNECDVVGIDINPLAAEEARKYCTSVLVSDLDETVMTELLEGRQFDAVVFADVLEHLHEPVRILDESRNLLSERGFVVASIPNVSHGAIRLALLSGRFDYQELGILDDSHLRFFTAKTIDELLLTAGFRIETVDRVTLPLFAQSDLVPALDPRDFDEKAVAEIKADPDSETLQFVVKAFPLSNDQRLRTISKRFLTANTELTASKQQVAHRENELETLRGTVQSQEAAIVELHEQMRGAQAQLETAGADFKQLEDAYRALEVDVLAKQNAALERTLAVQAEHARAVETIADLQSRIEDAKRLSAVAQTNAEPDGQTLEAAARAQSLETQAAVLRDEIAALANRNRELESRLYAESGGREQLAAELARERTRVAELSQGSQDHAASRRDLEQRLREMGDIGAQKRVLHLAIEALDAEVGAARLEVFRNQARFQAELQTLNAQIARTESDCDELLADAVRAVDGMRLHLETEQRRLEARHCEDAAAATELETQLAAIRKAAQADRFVMRQYADDSRQRAERAEKDLQGAIRQRDDLYLRVVDNDRRMREFAEHNARRDEHVRQIEIRLHEEQDGRSRAETGLADARLQAETTIAGLTARSDAAIAELTARSDATIAEITARSQSRIAELDARAGSLANDVAHQQTLLDHLRDAAGTERARADAAAAELASLTVRYEILQGNLADMENQLVAQTEQLLASTSDERDRLLTLIDTVQSSHFWRLKHWLARLRTRLAGSRAPARGA